MTRKQLIKKLDKLCNKLCRYGYEEEAEDILDANNASNDDSDPDEGFMKTMSDLNIEDAISEMEAVLYGELFTGTVESVIAEINGETLDASREYCEGFMDACRMIAEEYELSISGIDD